jgi:uncharacterized membrane protein
LFAYKADASTDELLTDYCIDITPPEALYWQSFFQISGMLLFSPIELLRDELSRLGTFWWMGWNAVLALIPVVLAIVFFKREDQPRQGIRNFTFWLEVAAVLLFLPNAPYVATDLIHFMETVRLTDRSLWALLGKEFPLYVSFVLFGLVCYSFTEDRLLYAIEKRLGRAWFWVGLFGIPVLSAVGVYLGRVARFNSWDILQTPSAIVASTTQAFDSVKVIKIIASMAVLLIVVHQFYKTFHDGIRARLAQWRK